MSQPSVSLKKPRVLVSWTVSDGGVQAYFDNVDRWPGWWFDVEKAVVAHGMPAEKYSAAMEAAARWWDKVPGSPDPRSEAEALDVWAMEVLGSYSPFEWEID